MLKFGRRSLSTSNICSNYARTTINPTSYTLQVQNPSVKAGILFVTPSLLPTVVGECQKFHLENPKVQLVVAGVDSMFNSKRNGISELWLNNGITVNEVSLLQKNEKAQPRESDGINIVLAKENWKISESNLTIAINKDINVNINLANTLFSTGYMSTLFILDGHKEHSGEALQTLSIDVDVASNGSSRIDSRDNWTPLYDYSDGQVPFIITKSIGNLVKEVNGKSASSFLQDNQKLMSIGSKDTQVYVKLYKKGNIGDAERFEVIAGGGGWGAKANTIVISPQASFAEGDRLEFYMLTPTDRFRKGDRDEDQPIASENSILTRLECSFEQITYNIDEEKQAMEVLEGVLSAGAESGYKLNGVQHFSAGERTNILL